MRFSFLLVVISLVFSSLAFGQDYKSLIAQAEADYKEKQYQKSVVVYESAFKIEAKDTKDLYNAGCSAAQAGKTDLAFEWLQKAAASNFADPEHLQKDSDLVSLHDMPQWAALVAAVQKNRDVLDVNIDKPLRAELNIIFDNDQKYRNQEDEIKKTYGRDSKQLEDLWAIIKQKDAENQVRVSAILDQRGWLGPDIVGREGSTALFLVIQHSNLKMFQKYLPMMRAAVKDGKARAGQLALLEDRTALSEGRHQTYGSQFTFNPKTGKYVVAPLEDPDNLDARRAAVGLPPEADYVKFLGLVWNLAEYKKMLPEVEKISLENRLQGRGW